jgi:hypothetical protein
MTTCMRGHALTDENVLVDNRGWRRCRACHRESALNSYHRHKRLRSQAAPEPEARQEGE